MSEIIQKNSDAERHQLNNDSVSQTADGDTEQPSPAVGDAEGSSPELEIKKLTNKLVEMTWKLMAIAKDRSESFFQHDPILFTANITQKVVELFCRTLLKIGYDEKQGSKVREDLVKLLPKILLLQDELFKHASELYSEKRKPRKATDQVAQDIMLQMEKVDTKEDVRDMLLERLHLAARINEESFEISQRLRTSLQDLLRLDIRLRISALQSHDVEDSKLSAGDGSLEERESHVDTSKYGENGPVERGFETLMQELRLQAATSGQDNAANKHTRLSKSTDKLRSFLAQKKLWPTKKCQGGKAREHAQLGQLMEKLRILSIETQGYAEDEEFTEQLGKWMIEYSQSSVPVNQEPKKMQLVRTVWELWQNGRDRYCADRFLEEKQSLPREERGGLSREKRMKQLRNEYGHEVFRGHDAAAAAGEDGVIELCDREPGSYLLQLPAEIREELLKDEDEDTRRVFGAMAK